ncbi:hypothetical protein [Salinibaculum salinum]|uniref:hypothetical protein n=1 Tax=Salinibaculum salinum TaxID=3131996 RepID=UPI0030EE5BE9
MNRRTVLRTLAGGGVLSLAGCSGSRVDGEVGSNDTPLTFSHDYETQGTLSGTRIVVDVTATNEGSEPITPDAPVPEVVCLFSDSAGETLYQSGREVMNQVGVGESIDMEFKLAVDVDDVARYTLESEWVTE